MECTRRSMLTGIAAAAGVAAMGTTTIRAHASEATDAATTPDADVLVFGGGLAGLCAGIHLLEDGLTPLIVEKASVVATHTNSAVAGGSFTVPGEAGVEAMIEDLTHKSEGRGDASLTKALCENVPATMDWLREHGCAFTDPVEIKPYSCQKVYAAPAMYQGMGTLMANLADAYEQLGGQTLCDTKLIDFVFNERGAVSGAIVRTPEGLKTLHATCCIIATGGYVGNKQLLEEFVGPEADEILNRGFPTMTGDGILAAERAGAMLRQMGGTQSLHIAGVSPDNFVSGNPTNGVAYCLAINTAGKRYTDESKGYVNNGKALMDQPGQTCALVFDADAKANVENIQITVDQFANLNLPIIETDTIEDLASQIQVDPDVLKQTIDEFNAASDGEKTTGLEVNKTANAIKVQTAPFYAIYPLRPGCIMGFGGVYCNADAEVLEADGTPIENLYAAGEVMGGLLVGDYMAGSSLDRSAVFGLIAAKSAAAIISA